MSETPKRKHRATGKKPPGGARPGAGRPQGSTNALGLGEARAVKALRLRVPESTPAPLADVADEAFGAIVGVMRAEYFDAGMAQARLRAAAMVREEVCGPVKQRVEHSFEGLTDEQLEARFKALTANQMETPQAPDSSSGEGQHG